MTFIFEGQPPQNKAQTPIKTRGAIWVPGIYRDVSKNSGTPNSSILTPMQISHKQHLKMQISPWAGNHQMFWDLYIYIIYIYTYIYIY